MHAAPLSRTTSIAIGFVALAGGVGWLRLLLGAVPKRGIRNAVAGLIEFESIYSAWAFIPLMWTIGLLLAAPALLAGPSAVRLPASTVVAAALVHLSSWAGFGWYHHGRFVGSTSSHGFVDAPGVALAGAVASLVAGCAVTAAVLPAAIRAGGPRQDRVRRAAALGGTHALMVIGLAVGVADPVALYLIPLMGLPWAAMLGISGWLVRPASRSLVAAAAVSAAAVLPVVADLGNPRDAPLEFVFFVGVPLVVVALAAVEFFAESRPASGPVGPDVTVG